MVLQGVFKRFARHDPWVLNGFDVVLEPGTGTFVTGTNGSGKSTVLRIAAGLARPTRGTASRATTTAYLPERQPESLRMTGSSYLTHFGRMRGLGLEAARTRISDLLGSLGLEPGPDVPIEDLSKGNRQKILVAQAFLCPVQLLVLDEPFSGLDAAAEIALRDLLIEARAAGAAILVSGHDAEQSLDGYRVLQIVDGRAVDRRPMQRSRTPGPTHTTTAVTLVDPTGRLDRAIVLAIPGVVEVRPSEDDWEPGRPVVVHVGHADTDRFLVASISAGWSVVSVLPAGDRAIDRASS